MRIAYILYQSGVISGRSNGIRSQALSCFNILNEFGDECVLIDNWGHYDWKSFDAIHIYGYDLAIQSFVKALSLKNPNIYLSPIIDSTKPYSLYKLSTFNGLEKLRLYSVNYALSQALKIVKGVCARSEHEAGFYEKSFGMPANKIFTVPLPFGIEEPSNIDEILNMKESFCFHLSSLYQERKNVMALINAAKKYNFNLVLAGNKGSEEDFLKIKNVIGNAKNIEVLGYLSDEKLKEMYTRAKVFALPSINEGVGIVAMDAAVYGCNIAITNLKGPCEYYPVVDTVAILDPYSSDDIGTNIVTLLESKNTRVVHDHMVKNFSRHKIYIGLKNIYTTQNK